jgi:hypothetical protein
MNGTWSGSNTTMSRLVWPVLLVVALALPGLAGCEGAGTTPSPSETPATHRIEGLVGLSGNFEVAPGSGDDCSGTGSFVAVAEGADVVMSDGAGATIGTTKLGPGSAADPALCTFTFVIASAPDTDWYAFEIAGIEGRWNDGPWGMLITREAFEDAGWSVEFEFGG